MPVAPGSEVVGEFIYVVSYTGDKVVCFMSEGGPADGAMIRSPCPQCDNASAEKLGHRLCYDKWLQQTGGECPFCRLNIYVNVDSDAAMGASAVLGPVYVYFL